jgi:hypothetical protein
MTKELEFVGNISSLLTSIINGVYINFDIPVTYHFLGSFSKTNIDIYSDIINIIADHDVNLDKICVMGDTPGILITELLKRHTTYNWIDFVSNNPENANIRSAYYDVNGIEKDYSDINMDPEEYSDPMDDYDLVICDDVLLKAEYGPIYAIRSMASEKLIKDYTYLNKHWHSNKLHKQNIYIGWFS